MTRSWAHRYADLSAHPVQVLTALTVLGTTTVCASDLAAALDVPVADVEAAVALLQQAGWFEEQAAGADPRLREAARIWLTYDAPERPDAPTAAAIAGRFLAYVGAGLDPGRHEPDDIVEWARRHADGIVRAIRAGVRAGLHAAATAVAASAWRVADRVANPAWWHQLARHGEDAATRAGDTVALIGLLTSSADVYADAGDMPAAEIQRVRACRLAFEIADHDRIVAALTGLIELYRRWKRPEGALDTLQELGDTQHRAGNPVGEAAALAEIGEIMLAADRPNRAEAYFSRADEILNEQPANIVSPRRHARILEQWGRAQWRLGHRIVARKCFQRALDLLTDVDAAAAARVQALIDTRTDADTLPGEEPGADSETG
ncbi:MAG TPA: hypothetical protein VGX25_16260 [Actinophytocola sp.]|uniref:hypothetical protein n=1 Tax=Actinophytocola sp. TaxID=1872138 RepID=UPI002DDCD6ED|nr:hypothetical protein [Actinophytocola sp.]HEV2780938.1 hypothetical protein [Actinophytocola sp.]